jgi:PAT family beta-lactamase induction signal transducer AmpG
MPLYVLISLVPAWLRSNQVNLATIGLFALVGLPYTWKFLWSPLMDRYKLPFLGRRRGWALLVQVALLLSIGVLGQFDPSSRSCSSSLCSAPARTSSSTLTVANCWPMMSSEPARPSL